MANMEAEIGRRFPMHDLPQKFSNAPTKVPTQQGGPAKPGRVLLLRSTGTS